MGIKNVWIEKTANIGKQWVETVTNTVAPKYCLDPVKQRLITITFPDGKQFKFKPAPVIERKDFAPITQVDMDYQQVPSDAGTAGAPLAAVGNNNVVVE